MATTLQERPRCLLRTTPITSPYWMSFQLDGVRYGVKYESFLRGFAPTRVDYDKTYFAKAQQLRQSGKKGLKFTLVAFLEDLEFQDDYVLATFVLPGAINQEFNIKLDPRRQDFGGSIGLLINATLEVLTE